MTHQDHNELLTVGEVAAYLRVPVTTVYRMFKTTRLRGVKVGKHWRCRREVVENYILQLEAQRDVDPPGIRAFSEEELRTARLGRP